MRIFWFLWILLLIMLLLTAAGRLAGSIAFVREQDIPLLPAIEKTIAKEREYIDHKEENDDQNLLERYRKYNKDCVGLIRIEGTVLNHPVMQTRWDETFYLNHDLDRNYNSHGIPLLSLKSDLDSTGTNRIIYGHNIYKNTIDVFGELYQYEELEYYKAHPLIRTVSAEGSRTWLIFAYFLTDNSEEDAFRYSEYCDFADEEEWNWYIDEIQKRNWLEVDADLQYNDTLITLSSCSRELSGLGSNRMVVVGKLVTDTDSLEEIIRNAGIREDPLLPSKLVRKHSCTSFHEKV